MKKFISRSVYSSWEPSFDNDIKEIDSPMPSEFVKEEFDFFLKNKDDVLEVLSMAGITSCWSFANALGDTIKEKYESFYLQLTDITSHLVHNGTQGYFWIISPMGFNQLAFPEEFKASTRKIFNTGAEEVMFVGTLFRRWRLFDCHGLPKDTFLIGANNSFTSSKHYAKLTISFD